MPELILPDKNLAESPDVISRMLTYLGTVQPTNLTIDDCMRTLEGIIKEKKNLNGSQKSISLLLGRQSDPYLVIPPEDLLTIFPLIFQNPAKARKFLEVYKLLQKTGLEVNVTTDIKNITQDIELYPSSPFFVLKLYQAHKWFLELPEDQRRLTILNKKILETTIGDVIESAMEKMEKGSKIIIYGPNNEISYKGYDSLRAVVEEGIFKYLNKRYGKTPKIEFRRDKDMRKILEYAQKLIVLH